MNKRLFLASTLLLITIFGVATFNFRATATEEAPIPTEVASIPEPSPEITEVPTEPSITPEVAISPEPTTVEATITPEPTEAEAEEEGEDEAQGASASTPNVQVVNNNNNTNNNNNEQRIYLEAPQVNNVTEGGFPVYEEPYYIEETPGTGAESLSLLGLIPTGIGGYFLRKKIQ